MRLRTLILDDDVAWRSALARWVSEWGYDVVESSSDEDWLSVLSTENPDMVLVDPGPTDSGILEQLLEFTKQSEVPVLVISDGTAAEASLELGAADFLPKPCSPMLIRARMRSQRKVMEARALLMSVNEELEHRVSERTEELAQLNRLFLQFVPRQYQDRIRATLKVEPGIYDNAEVTVLFLDVRGFTGLAERLGAERSVKLLGELFQNLVPMISDHGGYIDNFSGDSFMAIFEGGGSARNAANSAVAIQRWIFSAVGPGQGGELENIRVGIGINTGHVVYAAIGSKDRMASTVIGDQVNLCSRIEKLTKAFQCQVLVSASTHAALQPETRDSCCRLIDNLRVRGRSRPVEVYELFSGDPEPILRRKVAIRSTFLSGLAAYSARRFDEALHLFRECLKVYPQDAVSLEYVRRCRYFLKVPPASGFFENGVDEGHAFIDPAVRRRFPRYSLGAEVMTEFHHNDAVSSESRITIPVRIIDLSTEGMMIQAPHLPGVGSVFSLKTSFKGTLLERDLGLEVRTFVCQVRWTSPSQGRMGVSFIQLSQEEEESLALALSRASLDGRVQQQP